MNKQIRLTLAVSLGLSVSSLANAGGNLDAFNFIGVERAPGINSVEVVPISWDPRCANVEYTMDTILPNAGTAEEISLDDARTEIQTALDQWNDIKTSFINMNITEVKTIGNGVRSFDFINEVTFETPEDFTALASSPSTSLEQDTEFLVGDDIDGDGDSDVFDPEEAGRNTCFDFDGDGDIEFPAGFYTAGTIMDNDVQFGEAVLWSTQVGADAAADIQAVALHEFGHSHGLSHTAINQISSVDGSGSTMFPSIDIGDDLDELGVRSLHEDDIAWSAFTYPEGSADTGLAALQGDDVEFTREYAVLTGEVLRDGVGVVGASVFAETNASVSERTVSAISGTVLLDELADGTIALAPPEIGTVNGNYQIPVLRGNYEFGVQALDGSPVAGTAVSITAIVGFLNGEQDFSNEFLSTPSREVSIEDEPGRSINVPALPERPFSDLDFVINEDIVLTAYEDTDFVGTGMVIGQSDVVYAVRFSNASVLETLSTGATLTTATVNTGVLDASQVPTFKSAFLTTGRLVADGTIADVNTGFSFRSTQNGFFADTADDTPIFFNGAKGLSQRLINELQRDPSLDLFVVVETENDFLTGASGIPPLVGVDVDGPAFGDSFLSLNGGNLEVVDTLNFGIQLVFSPD